MRGVKKKEKGHRNLGIKPLVSISSRLPLGLGGHEQAKRVYKPKTKTSSGVGGGDWGIRKVIFFTHYCVTGELKRIWEQGDSAVVIHLIIQKKKEKN